MKPKPLIETNPYLRDPEKFRKALIANVASATAIETGAPIASIVRMLEEGEKSELPGKPQGCPESCSAANTSGTRLPHIGGKLSLAPV